MISKIKYRLVMIKALLPCYAGVKKYFFSNLIISLAIMLLTYANPFFYQIFIDDIIIGGEYKKIKLVLGGYLAVFCLVTIFKYLKLECTNRVINKGTYNVKLKIWDNIFEKKHKEYDSINIGDYQVKFGSDIDEIEQFADAQTVTYFINVLALVILAVILLGINWKLALISFIVIPCTFFLDSIVGKEEKKVLEIDRKNREEQAEWMYGSIQGWKEVKTLNLKEYSISKLFSFISVFESFFAKWNLYATTRKLVLPKIKDEFVMQFIMYFVGGIFILKGKLTIGYLLVFMQYYNYFSEAIKCVSSTDTDLYTGRVKSERILNELKRDYKKEELKKISRIDSIEFRNVDFKYDDTSAEVLNNLSFCINKGERVAIIGKSGAGKTTTAKLILGILNANSGEILINGESISDLDIQSLHDKIGVIMQDPFLLNASIMDNLKIGNAEATENDCIEACIKANIYDFILSLPDRFDTIIGEKGTKISGGQKQRLVLARCFLKDYDTYIFDEATSALDQQSESLIHDVINQICDDKTIIIIAHRKSSIDLCDRKIRIK